MLLLRKQSQIPFIQQAENPPPERSVRWIFLRVHLNNPRFYQRQREKAIHPGLMKERSLSQSEIRINNIYIRSPGKRMRTVDELMCNARVLFDAS